MLTWWMTKNCIIPEISEFKYHYNIGTIVFSMPSTITLNQFQLASLSFSARIYNMLELANLCKFNTVKLELHLCTMAPGINMKPCPSALCWKYLSLYSCWRKFGINTEIGHPFPLIHVLNIFAERKNKYMYSQTFLKRTPKGEDNSVLLRQVIS